MYDPKLLDQLSEAVGVKLKIRDNEKLKKETDEHLASQLLKKEQEARDSGVACDVDEDVTGSEAESIDRFYANTNRTD